MAAAVFPGGQKHLLNLVAGASLGQARLPRGAERERAALSFNAQVKVDRSAEWAEMFDDAWRT